MSSDITYYTKNIDRPGIITLPWWALAGYIANGLAPYTPEDQRAVYMHLATKITTPEEHVQLLRDILINNAGEHIQIGSSCFHVSRCTESLCLDAIDEWFRTQYGAVNAYLVNHSHDADMSPGAVISVMWRLRFS